MLCLQIAKYHDRALMPELSQESQSKSQGRTLIFGLVCLAVSSILYVSINVSFKLAYQCEMHVLC